MKKNFDMALKEKVMHEITIQQLRKDLKKESEEKTAMAKTVE